MKLDIVGLSDEPADVHNPVRGVARAGVALLALAPVTLGLTACGGGGQGTTTATVVKNPTATTPIATTPATSTPASAAPKSFTEAKAPAPSSGSGPSARGSGGGAASFKVAHGDNSIPTYGGEAHSSERARASAVLAAYLHDRANGSWTQACNYLAAATNRQLALFGKAAKGGAKGCGAVLAALSRGPAAARADVYTGSLVALRIKGKNAFALFHGPHNSKYVMPMIDENGAWKVSQLAPLAYPLGSSGATP